MLLRAIATVYANTNILINAKGLATSAWTIANTPVIATNGLRFQKCIIYAVESCAYALVCDSKTYRQYSRTLCNNSNQNSNRNGVCVSDVSRLLRNQWYCKPAIIRFIAGCIGLK